ncbi:hypothetical protein I315_06895 [Cryptococcus gattii Ru294]|nr:hypothetical protein I315_06895 [Cryptococcus gattii Ru294]
MKLNGTYDGILGLNFFKRYRLLDHTPLRHLLGHSGSAPKGNDIIVPTVTGNPSTPPDMAGFSELKSTKLSANMSPSTPVHLCAAETGSYADIIAKLKSEFAVFCDKLGDVADFPSVTKTKSGIRFEIILKPNATPSHAAQWDHRPPIIFEDTFLKRDP